MSRDAVMAFAFAADHADLFDRLDDEVRRAPAPAPGLFDKIVAGACSRIPVLSRAGKAARIDRLIAAGAWTDAALALVALELPAWELRRLICDGGEWFCSLSPQPNVPAFLDDTADGSHELLALAILRAFLQARRMTNAAPRPATVPAVRPDAAVAVCCDNFA
jgi:hypothetical protein